jgi:hypothetical protein
MILSHRQLGGGSVTVIGRWPAGFPGRTRMTWICCHHRLLFRDHGPHVVAFLASYQELTDVSWKLPRIAINKRRMTWFPENAVLPRDRPTPGGQHRQDAGPGNSASLAPMGLRCVQAR